jgi:hypothetical protein
LSSSLYPANQKLVEIKEPTISRIEVSTEDLDKLKRFLQSDRACPWTKDTKQRHIVGICSDCGDIPDFIVTRYYEGLQKIEKYCSKCMNKTIIKKNKKRDNQILSKVQVVESVSEFTKLHQHEQRPIDQ